MLNAAIVRICLFKSKIPYLHYLNELEKKLLSVLSFLLLNYQRAHPVGQKVKVSAFKERLNQETADLSHVLPIAHVVKVLCKLG